MTTEKTTSPKGELEWVNITGDGKENMSGKMQYVVSLVLDPDNDKEHAKYIKSIKDFWKENKPKGFKKPAKSMGMYPHTVKTDETDDEGKPIYEETGKTLLQFKTGTTFADGNVKVIKTFNSKAKEVFLGDRKIGNGSVGRISGAMGTYENTMKGGKVIDAGVTLYLDKIMLTKFIEFAQESGFEADDSEDEGFMGVEDEWDGDDEAPKAGPRL